MSRDYCFPFRVESIDLLRYAIATNPDDARANYYLGNLLYNLQPNKAIAAWERARELDPKFVTVHRNLGLAYANIQNEYAKGVASLRKAFSINPSDPVVLNDFEAVANLASVDTAKRLAIFDENAATSAKRDDSRLAHVNLCVLQGQYDRALELLAERHFRRWEGSDGPHAMYVKAHLLRGREYLATKQFGKAKKHFSAALEYPENFETGRSVKGGKRDAEVHWLLGVTAEALGQADAAKRRFEKVLLAKKNPFMEYYRALARKKLGDKVAAEKMFDGLICAGNEDLKQIAEIGPRFNFFSTFGHLPSVPKQTANAHYLIGLGYLGKRQYKKAEKKFQEAISWNSNHMDARTYLATLQRKKKK